MAKETALQILAPRQGIAQSPHLGFADVRNLDIYSVPGIVQLNNIMAKKSGTTVTAQPNWCVRHPIDPAQIYVLDSAGAVYKSSDSGATWAALSGTSSTNAHGNGLAIWKNYLFVARDTNLDVCGDGTSTGITAANWTLGWKTIDSDVLWHPMVVSKNDDKLYGGAGRYVFSLEELTTFAPGTSSTYTYTQQALDLPSSYRIKCMTELGNNLMLGTWQGTNIYDIRIADIFPWDRSSVSFSQPIQINDFGVHALYNSGNSMIVLAGISGIVYKSDGVNVIPIARLPMDLSGGKYLEFYPGALTYYKEKIFFGVGQGGSTATAGMGVYSLNQTGNGNYLCLEHLVSTLNDGTTNPLKPSTLLPVSRDTILVGWRDHTSYGLDLTTNNSYAYTTDYSGYFDTALYVVGSITNPRNNFTEINIEFVKELASGEGLKVSYRNNLTDSFTTIGTYTFSTLGAVISHTDTPGIPGCELVQFRVALLGSTTTPQLKSITIQ